MGEQDENIKRNNTKIAVTAIFSILLGFAFILALILFGMSAQRDYANMQEKSAAKNKSSEEVVSIIGLEYSSASFGYVALNDVAAPNGDSTQAAHYKSSLLNASGLGDKSYAIIDNNDKLENLISNLRDFSGDETLSYVVDEKFMSSGTIIAISSESNDLSSLTAKSVVRDQDYNIQVNVEAKKDAELAQGGDTKRGILTLVKIHNVQPKEISVVWE